MISCQQKAQKKRIELAIPNAGRTMDIDTLTEIALLIGIVLIVLAIGLRARLEDPLLLLHKPALGLRAMAAMFVVLPLFALLVTRLFPLQQGVGAALLGFAVSPMLPPWAKTGAKIGGHGDYVFGLQVLATGVSIFVVPVMLWLVAWIFDIKATFESLDLLVGAVGHSRRAPGNRHGDHKVSAGRGAADCRSDRTHWHRGASAGHRCLACRQPFRDPWRYRPGHLDCDRCHYRLWAVGRTLARWPRPR